MWFPNRSEQPITDRTQAQIEAIGDLGDASFWYAVAVVVWIVMFALHAWTPLRVVWIIFALAYALPRLMRGKF